MHLQEVLITNRKEYLMCCDGNYIPSRIPPNTKDAITPSKLTVKILASSMHSFLNYPSVHSVDIDRAPALCWALC